MGPGSGIWRPENYERQVLRPLDAALRHRAIAQRHDGAPGAGHRHAADRANMPSGSASMTNLPPYLSYALGAGETTVLRMVAAYSMFDNGGRQGQPTLIDRIQDRYGHTIYKHDQRECIGCDADKWDEPDRADAGRQARAGDRPDDRLSDHLDDGGRGASAAPRHARSARSASRSPARPAPPTTKRTSGSSAISPDSSVGVYHGLRQAAAYRATAPPAARSPRRSSGTS